MEITPNKILIVFGIMLVLMPIACLGATAQENLMATIDNVTNLIVTVSLGFAIMMYVVGGFFYMTAAGDTKKIESGKNILLYTTVGLVIILAAKVIANVVSGLVVR